MPIKLAKMRDLEWDDLRFVLAVARHGSFSGAARQLSVNESTVARRIAKAEQGLAAQLFERGAGGLVATQAGAALARRAERIEAEVRAVEETIRGSDLALAGQVQVTSVPSIVNHIIAPQLPALLRRHPHLQVNLIAESADLSLLRGDADIALRLARPQKEARAMARRIADIPYGIFASAAADADCDTWLDYVEAMSHVAQSRWLAQQMGRAGGRISGLRVNDSAALYAATKAGAGKAFLPLFMAGGDPGLRRIDDGKTLWSRELWLMVRPDLKGLARIRILADWLIERVQKATAVS